jgi:hypothetical protein
MSIHIHRIAEYQDADSALFRPQSTYYAEIFKKEGKYIIGIAFA